MGLIIGGSIAAAGLVAAFFIVSRNNSVHETRGPSAAQHPIAMNAVAPASQPAVAALNAPAPQNAQPATPPQAIALPQPAAPVAAAANAQAEPDPGTPAAAHAAATVANEPGAAAAAPAIAAAPAAPVAQHAPAAANEAPATHGDVAAGDPNDHAAKGKAGKGGAKVAARGAKSETPKGDMPAYEAPKEAPAAGGSFLQALGKTPELAGQAAAAPPAAAPPAAAEPTPPALPAAPTAPKTGLAAAIQKAGGAQDAPPAAAAPRAAAAPATAPAAAPVTPAGAGVPDAPSQGAIASALAANNRAAKACVKGQEAPSRASVTFGSDGKVQTISVAGPAVGTPAEECIKQALQKGTVPPFSRPSYNVGITIRP